MEDESTLDLLEEINTLRTENRYYKEQLALALSKIKDLRKRLAVEHDNQRESLDCIVKVTTAIGMTDNQLREVLEKERAASDQLIQLCIYPSEVSQTEDDTLQSTDDELSQEHKKRARGSVGLSGPPVKKQRTEEKVTTETQTAGPGDADVAPVSRPPSPSSSQVVTKRADEVIAMDLEISQSATQTQTEEASREQQSQLQSSRVPQLEPQKPFLRPIQLGPKPQPLSRPPTEEQLASQLPSHPQPEQTPSEPSQKQPVKQQPRFPTSQRPQQAPQQKTPQSSLSLPQKPDEAGLHQQPQQPQQQMQQLLPKLQKPQQPTPQGQPQPQRTGSPVRQTQVQPQPQRTGSPVRQQQTQLQMQPQQGDGSPVRHLNPLQQAQQNQSGQAPSPGRQITKQFQPQTQGQLQSPQQQPPQQRFSTPNRFGKKTLPPLTLQNDTPKFQDQQPQQQTGPTAQGPSPTKRVTFQQKVDAAPSAEEQRISEELDKEVDSASHTTAVQATKNQLLNKSIVGQCSKSPKKQYLCRDCKLAFTREGDRNNHENRLGHTKWKSGKLMALNLM